jgi:hypothetical protein
MDANPRRILLISLAMAVVVAAVVARFWQFPMAPKYQGKSLAYWVNELPLTGPMFPANRPTFPAKPFRQVESHFVAALMMNDRGTNFDGTTYGSIAETPNASLKAVLALGTNAIPFLLRRLEQPNRRSWIFQRWIQIVASRIGIKRRLFHVDGFEKEQAITGLLALSPLSADAVRQIEYLSTNGSDSGVRTSALGILWATDTNYFMPGEVKDLAAGIWPQQPRNGLPGIIVTRSPLPPGWHAPMLPPNQ